MAIEMTSRTIIEKLYHDLREKTAALTEQGRQPKLGIVLVGDDKNSLTYISMKQRQAEDLGIGFSLHRLDENASEETVLTVIDTLNSEPSITGIIVQLPLPEHLDTDKILKAVAAEKDVDGLRPGSTFTPPTAAAILQLLHEYDIALEGKKIVLVGKGRLVGGPLMKILRDKKLDVTACDESTGDLGTCTLQADILISGTGETHLIQPSMVKEGAVVIDADHDVIYDAVIDKVDYITPQKGGVGPLTVAHLLANVVLAAEQQVTTRKEG